MVSSPKPPSTPDPFATAAAQQLANIEVAIANTVLANADEEAPGGTVTYQIDSYFPQTVQRYDDTGNPTVEETIQVPRYKRIVAFTAGEQTNYDLDLEVKQSMLVWARDQANRSNELLADPFDLNDLTARVATPTVPALTDALTAGTLVETINGATDANIETTRQAILDRVEYQIDLRRTAKITGLNNQGLYAGMEAYDRELLAFDRQSNDASFQSEIQARQEDSRVIEREERIARFANDVQQIKFQQDSFIIQLANRTDLQVFEAQVQIAEYVNTVRSRDLQESVTERSQVLNEISTIKSGGQVTVPQFAAFRPGRISDTPIGEYVYRSAAMDQAKHQQQAAQQQDMLGGLMGLGASLALAPMTGGGSLMGSFMGGKQ